MFQVGLDPSLLGQSKTNCLAYSVWLHGVALIVCTNKWLDDVTEWEDLGWLERNCVVQEVKDYLFFDKDLLSITNA